MAIHSDIDIVLDSITDKIAIICAHLARHEIQLATRYAEARRVSPVDISSQPVASTPAHHDAASDEAAVGGSSTSSSDAEPRRRARGRARHKERDRQIGERERNRALLDDFRADTTALYDDVRAEAMRQRPRKAELDKLVEHLRSRAQKLQSDAEDDQDFADSHLLDAQPMARPRTQSPQRLSRRDKSHEQVNHPSWEDEPRAQETRRRRSASQPPLEQQDPGEGSAFTTHEQSRASVPISADPECADQSPLLDDGDASSTTSELLKAIDRENQMEYQDLPIWVDAALVSAWRLGSSGMTNLGKVVLRQWGL